MTDNNQIPLPFDLQDVNRAWSSIVAQLVISELTTRKELDQLKINCVQFRDENVQLKAELSQLRSKLIATEGKQIIDESRIIDGS